jgi:hypothetical protein
VVFTAPRGLTVELPAGWKGSGSCLTPHLTDLREVLAFPALVAVTDGRAIGILAALRTDDLLDQRLEDRLHSW